MEKLSPAELEKILVHLSYEDKIKVRFTPENSTGTLELGAIVKEVTRKYLVVQIACIFEGASTAKTIAIPTERITSIEWGFNEAPKKEEPEKISFCEQPKITNRFINTIQTKVKWPNSNGKYGDWDGLPMDVRKFLKDCADYMLSLEIVAKEGIELKQSLEKARLEREDKTLYEKSSYVYAAYFRRHSHDEPEMGFVINEDVLLDASGKIVYNVYDCQTRDDLGAMTMYVPVSKEISAADCPEYAVAVLQKLIESLKGKYYTAQSRQYNGDRPSGRMYGIGEAIDLLTDAVDRIKKGEYNAYRE